MCGDEWIHKRLEVGSPPLSKRVANLPFIVYALTRELGSNWGKSLVQPCLEALDFIVLCAKVIARSSVRISVQVRISTSLTYSLKKAFAICSIKM
jgi:hypothetical protein